MQAVCDNIESDIATFLSRKTDASPADEQKAAGVDDGRVGPSKSKSNLNSKKNTKKNTTKNAKAKTKTRKKTTSAIATPAKVSVELEKDEGIDSILKAHVPDETLREYCASMLDEAEDTSSAGSIFEVIGDFLISSEFCADESAAMDLCRKLASVHSGVVDEEQEKAQSAAPAQRRGGYDLSFRETEDEAKFMYVSLGPQKEYNSCFENTLDDVYEDMDNRKAHLKKKVEEEARRAAAAIQRQEEALRREREEALRTLPSRLNRSTAATSDIHVDNITISSPSGEILMDEGKIRFVYGRKYGMVGRNGCGKSTFIRAMARRDIPGFPQDLRVLHVAQEVDGDERSVLNTVLESDFEVSRLRAEEARLRRLIDDGNDGEDLAKQLSDVYATLEALEASTAKAQASDILRGLQFSAEMLGQSTNKLSGGWRMRVALAVALFLQPDLLLLDEPTNHLDLEACIWLENYLQEFEPTVVLVSHDRRFVNAVATDVLHFDHQKKSLNYFRGDYDSFQKVLVAQKKRQKKAYEAQQAKRAHMQKFIDKNRYKAALASMAQSRIKALERMEVLEDVVEDALWRFEFPDPGELGSPVLQINDVSFSYTPGGRLILDKVNFGLDLDSRVCLLGANGAGKSTLLKLIMGGDGAINPTDGWISRNPGLRMAMFTQHHVDQLDLRLTAIENLQRAFPKANLTGLQGEEACRRHLGRFGVSNSLATMPVICLSGGQKSRLAFAIITYRRPHVIIMDEPTNHLDLETIQALADAVQSFQGGIVIVTHDQSFIDAVATEIWVLGDGKVQVMRGGLDAYRKVVERQLRSSS